YKKDIHHDVSGRRAASPDSAAGSGRGLGGLHPRPLLGVRGEAQPVCDQHHQPASLRPLY
ncbi:MAG: hypothetical protein ACK559_35175, partial [bacterium]